MKVFSSFKSLEHTPALDEKIHEKSQKLQKYFEGNLEVHWTCYVRDDGSHCADTKVIGPSFEYHASAFSDSLYKAFDLVMHKIERQVQKRKSKWKDHKKNQSLKNQWAEEQIKVEEKVDFEIEAA
jgi:putative sigma-54 modulation protein